jgi:hypothetical protein
LGTSQDKALVKKQDLRILPLSALCYFILNLDRSNIGNAKTMNADTHNDLLSETNMSERGYIISLMVFFIIYASLLLRFLVAKIADCFAG